MLAKRIPQANAVKKVTADLRTASGARGDRRRESLLHFAKQTFRAVKGELRKMLRSPFAKQPFRLFFSLRSTPLDGAGKNERRHAMRTFFHFCKGKIKRYFSFFSMDLNPRVLNHGGAVHGIRNLLRYGIDCKAIVWNQAAEKCTFGDAIRLRRYHTR